jgi:hypothetical protein
MHVRQDEQACKPTDARLRFLAGRIHGLGSGPLYYLLRELVDGAEPWARLEAYGKLAPLTAFIAALEADRLPGLRAISGGRQ